MSDDDLIAALHQQVRQEVLEHYFQERLIVEEEINLVSQDTCAYQGGLERLARGKARLAGALITPEAVEEFFQAAGMRPPSLERCECADPLADMRRPGGLTRGARHRRLVGHLYRLVRRQAEELGKERSALLALVEEVNADIRRFERNFDFFSIAAYLRSLDPAELQRRKIMGVNFTAGETRAAADDLSFRPINPERLELGPDPSGLPPWEEVQQKTREMLRGICREHPREVAALV